MFDHSGTIAVGGTSQIALAAEPGRDYLLIANVHATADLYFNFGAAAVVGGAGSIRLPAGGGYDKSGPGTPSDAIHVNAAVGGQAYTLKTSGVTAAG